VTGPGSSASLSSVEVVTALRAAGCVFAEDEAALLMAEASAAAELRAMLGRRISGEPLEYILGWAEFCGLRIVVTPGVFVPRRRTAFMVDLAANVLGSGAAVVVDLCCGSGAVGAALAARVSGIELHAADIDPRAVECARRNTAPFAGRCYVGDLWQALPGILRGRIDVLVVNAPYVPTAEVELMPREARGYEARAALDGGLDGLDLHRRIATDARAWLGQDGRLFIETSARQAPVTAGILAGNGLTPRVEHRADDDATVVIARRD
jgi:release factor glutamine methyltransferase